MRFIYILIMVLLVAQGLWGITLYVLHWWLRPVLTELVRLRIWMVAGLVLANLSMLAPHYLVPARQWHWLIGLLLFAFYGFVLTLVLAALQAILIRWFPVVRVHSLVRM